jgi:hypothetical protein
MLGEAEEGSLLGVGEGEGFQAAEDDWVCIIVLGFGSNCKYADSLARLTVCDDDRVAVFNGLVGNGCGEVNCEEDRVLLYPGFVERSFEEHYN